MYNEKNLKQEISLMLEDINEINKVINKQVNEYSEAKFITNKRNIYWNCRTQIGILNELMERINDLEKCK
jgi:hypothetical protein